MNYNCKICGTPGEVQTSPLSDSLWNQKLAPMLTCNPCFDRCERRRTTERGLVNACLQLAQKRDSAPAKFNDKFWIQVLTNQTRSFAEAVRVERKRRAIVWDYEFVQLLFDAPREVGKLLHHYLRGLPEEMPEQAHFHDP